MAEFCDVAWNPVVGCEKVSPGCRICNAETTAARLASVQGPVGTQYGEVIENGRWNGCAVTVPEALKKPAAWRRSRRIHVCSMGDLFHEDIPNEFIAAVFAAMAVAPEHTFMVSTKRAQRMHQWFRWLRTGARSSGLETLGRDKALEDAPELAQILRMAAHVIDDLEVLPEPVWPLPNVWLGVSVENQEIAQRRMPLLLRCPAAVRWISYEPALGSVELDLVDGAMRCPTCGYTRHDVECQEDHDLCSGPGPALDWVVCGGETGWDASVCKLHWIRDMVEQCLDAGVPIFVKQIGANAWESVRTADRSATTVEHRLAPYPTADRNGADPQNWPDDIRIREWPVQAHCRPAVASSNGATEGRRQRGTEDATALDSARLRPPATISRQSKPGTLLRASHRPTKRLVPAARSRPGRQGADGGAARREKKSA